MMTINEVELKNELKQELIDYYNKLKSDVDTKSLKLLKNINNLHHSSKEEKRDLIFKEKIYLIKQIDRVCDSNLNDLEQLFELLENNRQSLSLMTSNNDNVVDDNNIIKNEIKKRILNSYLIFVNQHRNYVTKYGGGGVLFEFQWFLDQNQQNFMYLPLILL